MRAASRILPLLLALLSLSVSAQTTRIDGRVTDASTRQPLPGAAVYFSGTYIGVATDSLGCFRLETDDMAANVLTVELLGYAPQSLRIVPGSHSTVQFTLRASARELQAARVKPDNRYMKRLLARIDENRARHDPEARPGYSCDVYSKNQLDLAQAATYLDNGLVRKHFDFVIDYIDNSPDGYLPALISESYGRRYHVQEPPLDREVLSGSRIAGFNPETPLLQFTGATHLKTNFYKRYINAFGLEIPSPLMTRGTVFYNYYLIDSLAVDGRKTYHIRFHPKQLVSTPVFDGEMYIDAGDYALRSLNATLHNSPNINWISHLSFAIENRPDSTGTWFYKSDRMKADMAVNPADSARTIGVRIRREHIYDHPVHVVPDRWEETGEEVVVLPEARERDEGYWEEVRPEGLNGQEQGIYDMVERVQAEPVYQGLYSLANTLATGYYEMQYLGIGKISNIVSFNQVEGFKPRLSLRTTKGFSKKLRLMASLGYATRTRAFTGDGMAEYMFSNLPTRRLFLSGQHDYLQLGKGASGIGAENDLYASVLSKTKDRKFGLVDQLTFGYEHEWKPGFSQTLTLDGLRLFDSPGIPFARQDGQPVTSITSWQAGVSTRLSWKETVTRGSFEKQSLDTKFPIVTVDLAAGLAGPAPDYNRFLRTQASLDWRFNIPPLGRTKLYLEAGGVFGAVPFPLLKIHSGSDSYFYVRKSFACMRVYEFASDRWLTGFWEHHFHGLFLGKIPIIKALGLEEVAEARFAWGTLSGQNRGTDAILHMPGGISSLEKPYIEAGFGISNIFRLLRVDALWRLTHREAVEGLPAPERFTVCLGFDIRF